MDRVQRILLGYASAVLAATFLFFIVTLGLRDALAGQKVLPAEQPLWVTGLTSLGISVMIGAFVAALMALPAGAAILWAERRGARGIGIHAVLGALIGGGTGLVMEARAWADLARPEVLRDAALLVPAAMAGALVYWAISGRKAGAP